MDRRRTYLEYDWFADGIPGNVTLGEHVFVDSSYAFTAFHSEVDDALLLGSASGSYDRATFVTGPEGRIAIGPYTILNGVYLICRDHLTIGAHCLLAWGSVITDSWNPHQGSPEQRRSVLEATASDDRRMMPAPTAPEPVVLEDNVWVGFNSVVLPGVTLGHGCIIGSATIVDDDIPPYAVAVGNPVRIVRYLNPDDSEEARALALKEHRRG